MANKYIKINWYMRSSSLASHITTILNIWKATGPILTKFHVQPPWSEGMNIYSNFLSSHKQYDSHAGKWLKHLQIVFVRNQWNLICSVGYSSNTKLVQIMNFGWPWLFCGKSEHRKMLEHKISWKDFKDFAEVCSNYALRWSWDVYAKVRFASCVLYEKSLWNL